MKWKTIQEGLAKITIPYEGKISRKLPVFYNPVMKLNRDLSVLLLEALAKKRRIGLPLAGTGIRGIRFLLELKSVEVDFNDHSKEAGKLIKKNLKKNKVEGRVYSKDADLFLFESHGYDYIDIDPFGTPVPFLDMACKRLSRGGVLAVTATDTSALAGTYPDACMRKYWAVPLRNELQHEIGLRILIRRIQLIGAGYEKALIPVFSYSKDHYMRVFFLNKKGKKNVDKVLSEHGIWNAVGPIWKGKLVDKKIVKKMIKLCVDEKIKQFLSLIESEKEVVGFYDLHAIAKQEKWCYVPKMEDVFSLFKKKASRTHFSPTGIKVDIGKKEFLAVIKEIIK